MPDWNDVVDLGARLPGVDVTTSYGTPALKVRDKLICRLRTNPDALVVRVIDLEDRDALVRGEPDAFFITPHYQEYPYVLVRLEAVDPVALGELVEDAWRTLAPKRLVAEHDRARS
jgi:hypothetical protein